MVHYGIFLNQLSLTSILIPILCTLHKVFNFRYSYQRCGKRSTSINPYSFIWLIFHIKIHLISKNCEVNFGEFFLNREKVIFRRKYRFSRYRYMITVRKIEIRMRRQKFHIGCKNHLESPRVRFWPFFLVRYLDITPLTKFFLIINIKELGNILKEVYR